MKMLLSRVLAWFSARMNDDRYYQNIVDRVDLHHRLRARGLGGL